MTVLRFLYALTIIFILATFIFVSRVLANNDLETASSIITTAEDTIVSAYNAVIEAEQAGGNVSSLFARLNEAGELLAAARMSYKNGDFVVATYLANLSRNIAEDVENAAYELKNLAWSEGFQRMLFAMLGSIFGIIIVVLGSFWLWGFLKRRY